MPEAIQLFRVLLAAPSDVIEEHPVVAGVINDWNLHHGDSAGARVELMSWRTHAYPEVGKRPQALINQQFADRADIVIAIFWRRLGSPTGKAASGTVEEIDRAIRRGKKLMIYFSQRPGTGKRSDDARETAKIEQYKRKLGLKALYGTYADSREFEIALRKDLALIMRDTSVARRKKR